SSKIPKNEHLRNLFVKRLDFYSINSFIWNMKNSALDNFNLLLYFCMNWASYIYMTFWRVQINETNATFNHILYGTIFNWYVNDEYNCYICKRNNSRFS